MEWDYQKGGGRGQDTDPDYGKIGGFEFWSAGLPHLASLYLRSWDDRWSSGQRPIPLCVYLRPIFRSNLPRWEQEDLEVQRRAGTYSQRYCLHPRRKRCFDQSALKQWKLLHWSKPWQRYSNLRQEVKVQGNHNYEGSHSLRTNRSQPLGLEQSLHRHFSRQVHPNLRAFEFQ